MREDDAPCHRWDETGSKAERGKLRGASGCRCFSVKLSIRGGHDVVHRVPEFRFQLFQERRDAHGLAVDSVTTCAIPRAETFTIPCRAPL